MYQAPKHRTASRGTAGRERYNVVTAPTPSAASASIAACKAPGGMRTSLSEITTISSRPAPAMLMRLLTLGLRPRTVASMTNSPLQPG